MVGEPFPYESYPSPGPTAPPPRATRTGDVVVTIVELVLLGLGGLFITALVALFAGLSDDTTGDEDTAVTLILAPTLGLWLVAAIVSTVLIARKRLAFWVPLVAFVLWGVTMAVIFDGG